MTTVRDQRGWNLGSMGDVTCPQAPACETKGGCSRQLQVVRWDYEWGPELWGLGLKQPVEKISKKTVEKAQGIPKLLCMSPALAPVSVSVLSSAC